MHPGDFGKSSIGPLGGSFKDAIRFWEPRRLAYNSVLVAAAAAWLALTWAPFPSRIDAALACASRRPRAAGKCLLLRGLLRGSPAAALLSQFPLATTPVDPVVARNPLRICPRELLDC